MLQIDFLVYCLRKNYIHVYHLINSLQQHVYRLQRMLIIDTVMTNDAINSLRTLIMDVNIEYNLIIKKYHDNYSIDLVDEKFRSFSNKEKLYDFLQSCNPNNKLIHPYSTNNLYPLLDIIQRSIDCSFMSKYGISSLKYLQIIHGKCISCNSIGSRDPHILNNFIIYTLNVIEDFTIENYASEIDNIQFGSIHIRLDDARMKVIDSLQYVYTSSLCIQFKIANVIYSCEGFFANDFLHLDTKAMCQCLFPKLYRKKEILFDLLKYDHYSEDCVKMCDKALLLALSNDDIIANINDQKKEYDNLRDQSYKQLIDKYGYANNNDLTLFKIIKTLLTGSHDSVFKASMLFTHTSKINYSIAQQIYFHLPYPLQLAICENISDIKSKNPNSIENNMINEKFIDIENNIGTINTICVHGPTHNMHGTILNIQICPNYEVGSKFKFIFTGCPDDIMKQSIRCSYSCAMEFIRKTKKINVFDILASKFPCGFHIHLGDFDSIKSGSSACCAITIAFISLVLDKKIKNNILATGTIDILGNVYAVGDMNTKLHTIANEKYAVEKILIPKDNFDLLLAEEIASNKFTCIPVSTILEVFDIMF